MDKQHKILIVDDEPEIVKSLAIRLKAAGYQPTIATDAYNAVSLAFKEPPDLILLDLNMPAGGGHIVAERLKNSIKTMDKPILVLSARTSDVDRQMAINNGVYDYITKPFDPTDLLERIDAALTAHAT